MDGQEPEWITKVDVAERQLRAAIRMFFEEQDPVAVHTVAAAGHQVLVDMARLNGLDSLLKPRNAPVSSVHLINYPANFFKHADRDTGGRINVAPLREFTAELLMDFVLLFQRQEARIPFEAKLYWMWFVTKHRELFEGSVPAEREIQRLINLGLNPDDLNAVRTLLQLHDVLGEEGGVRRSVKS